MSKKLINRPTLVPEQRKSTRSIKAFFEDAELVIVSIGRLVTKCESTALKLFVLFHLVLDLIIVAYVMLGKLG